MSGVWLATEQLILAIGLAPLTHHLTIRGTMTFDELYDALETQEPKYESCGWIQWKGTDVCIDLHCACGNHSHADRDFLYYWRCPDCHRVYSLAPQVKLIPLTDEQAQYVMDDRPNLMQDGDNE